MAIVRIEDVRKADAPDHLIGAAIDRPRSGARFGAYTFGVRGWVLDRSGPVKSVQLTDGERIVSEGPPRLRRPDVAEALTDRDPDERCGFSFAVRSLELPPEFELELRARIDGGAAYPIATIRGSRRRLPSSDAVEMSPVMLTTIGRSGSKWLALLLSRHPKIAAYEPLVFEPRVVTYWLTVFRSLATPHSYLRQIHADNLQERRWWLGDGAGGLPAPLEDSTREWLGSDAVESLALTCQERIDAFYRHVAEVESKPGAELFVEKFLLQPPILNLTTELFPRARELVLVRDLRDWVSSVFAWNRKRGQPGFGQDPEMSDTDYVRERARSHANALLSRWRERSESAHLVRYEDLVVDPAGTLEPLLRYLDVDSSADLVGRMLEEAASAPELLDAHRTVEDPLKSIGRWREDLPSELAEVCDEVLGPVLTEFGYEI